MTNTILDSLGKPVWTATWAEDMTRVESELRQEVKQLRAELKAAVEIAAKAFYSYQCNRLYPDDPTPDTTKALAKMKRAIRRELRK